MRHLVFPLVVCTAALSGCASNSTADADTASGNQVAATGSEEELVCERIKTTGTRFTQKVCMTEEQWEAKRAAMQEGGTNTTREWQRRGKMANDVGTNIGG